MEAETFHTCLNIDITGLKPEKVIRQLEAAKEFLEEVRKGNEITVPSIFSSDGKMTAVKVSALGEDCLSITMGLTNYEEGDKATDIHYLATLSRVSTGNESFVEPAPDLGIWMKTNVKVEEFLLHRGELILQGLKEKNENG